LADAADPFPFATTITLVAAGNEERQENRRYRLPRLSKHVQPPKTKAPIGSVSSIGLNAARRFAPCHTVARFDIL